MSNKYVKELLDFASKLDAIVGDSGEITKLALIVTEIQDEVATIALLKKINAVVDSKNYSSEVKMMSKVLKEHLIKYYGYLTVLDICNNEIQTEDKRSLQELLSDLEALIGLGKVKSQVNKLIAYQKVQQMRKAHNLVQTKNTLHLAFLGNPGTGKTTVARIVGHIYKKIGLLSKGHFLEVSRTDLIAGYQGQTAIKVKKVIEKAKGGVLFIDEAYSITENDQSDSYGRECLTELTKALEDYREDLVVIVAGYIEPMNKFFESNPGLKSRFNTFIEFEDYCIEELEAILISMCNENEYILHSEAKNKIKITLTELVEKKDESFSNARLVRNIFDELLMNHAKRAGQIENPTKDELSIILAEDFQGI